MKYIDTMPLPFREFSDRGVEPVAYGYRMRDWGDDEFSEALAMGNLPFWMYAHTDGSCTYWNYNQPWREYTPSW